MQVCAKCKKVINNNDHFILEGKYPGLAKKSKVNLSKGWLTLGPDSYGPIYHYDCFISKLNPNEPLSDDVKEETPAA